MTVFSYEPLPEVDKYHDLANLNNSWQILDLKAKGEKFMDVYIFRMEEFLPYITEHLSSYIRYWNDKLRNLIKNKEYEKERQGL